jgi:DNA-binding NarL/FixJ family response regulator
MISLVIADDHPVIIDGLKIILKEADDIQLVSEVHDGNSLIEKLKEKAVDVVLLDINMPGMNGIDACIKSRELFDELRILVFSQYDDKHFVKRVLKCGAVGYLLKNSPSEEIIAAIRTVYSGGMYLSKDLPNIFGSKEKTREGNGLMPNISKRETEVLKLICSELNTQEIAEKLFISAHTVESHRSNLLLKIGARNTAGLVKWAMENEIL